MTGKIEIICDENGTHITANVQTDKQSDRVFLTHALGKALELEVTDYICMTMAEMSGVMDSPIQVSIDAEELMRQLKEEDNEG